MTVFRFVSTVGFLAFGWAVVPMSIWYGHVWSTTKITDTLTGKTQLGIDPVDNLINGFKPTRGEFGFLIKVKTQHLPGKMWPGP